MYHIAQVLWALMRLGGLAGPSTIMHANVPQPKLKASSQAIRDLRPEFGQVELV